MPFLLLLLAVPVLAQNLAPQWIEESWCIAHYPSAEWYTGFARDKIKDVYVENAKTKKTVSLKIHEGKGGWTGGDKNRAKVK